MAEAVLSDPSIPRHGFEVVALFHPDPAFAGLRLGGRETLPLSKLPDLSRRMGIKLAILAVGPEWAEKTAEALAASDIRGVLDLTGSPISLPARMVLVRESFGTGLSALAGELRKKQPSN
jgi:NADH/NAD ratio-sensing transcriptional regulator Rex